MKKYKIYLLKELKKAFLDQAKLHRLIDKEDIEMPDYVYTNFVKYELFPLLDNEE